MKQETVICDACSKDLTCTGSFPDFRLKLGSERMPHEVGIIFAPNVINPMEVECHFCGFACLRKWLKTKD